MSPARPMPATFALVALALIGCTQQADDPTDGSASAMTPPASTSSGAPVATDASLPSPTGSSDVAVVVPGEFTICIPINETLRTGTDEQDVVPHPEGDMTIEAQRGYTWSGTHTATDSRFSGTHYYSWDGDTYTIASGDEGPVAHAEGLRIENADGAWQGEGTGLTLPDGTSAISPLVMTGERGYEGLTAVLIWTEGACFLNLRGIVMEFPDPPVPATTGD